MKGLNLYHGTSSKAFETIKKVGFVFGEPRFHNWLSPQGIYLTPNRPLVARRFAKKASRSDFSEPVVLKITIILPNADRILDLTTDKGMNRLYKAYVKVKALFSTFKVGKLGINVPQEYGDYLDSIKVANKLVLDKLDEANKASKDDPRRFNWDTVAISLIIEELGIQLIIAAIQEGTSFNISFSSREPSYSETPRYFGIRLRDHIEYCITDLSIIKHDSITVRNIEQDMKEFDTEYVNWITNIDAPDGVS